MDDGCLGVYWLYYFYWGLFLYVDVGLGGFFIIGRGGGVGEVSFEFVVEVIVLFEVIDEDDVWDDFF